MQQNWLVGLTVAPMKLATSGQGSPRNPHDHWCLVGYPLILSETLPSVSLGIDGANSRHVDDVTNAVTAL